MPAAPPPLSNRRRFGTLAAAAAVLIGAYALTGVYTASGPMHEVPTPLDAAIPFQPAWVLVYALVFLQAVAPIATVNDARSLDRTVAAYLTLYAFAIPVWLAWPVTVPRSPVPIVDVWTYGVALVRYVDPPGNCLPSMHVGLAVMAALVVRRHDPRLGVALLGSAALIWWSTLSIRQHWTTDGLVAAAMALTADQLWFGVRPLPPEALRPLPRRWHLTWIGAYAGAVLVLMSGWFLRWMPLELLPPNAPRW